jgi:hypothetical protein
LPSGALGSDLLLVDYTQLTVALRVRDWDGFYLFTLTLTNFARNSLVRKWGSRDRGIS